MSFISNIFCCCKAKKNKVLPPDPHRQPNPNNSPHRQRNGQMTSYHQALNPRFNTMHDSELPPIPITIFNSMLDSQNGVLMSNMRQPAQEPLIIPSFRRTNFLKLSEVKFIERPPMSVAFDRKSITSNSKLRTLKSDHSIIEVISKRGLNKSILEDSKEFSNRTQKGEKEGTKNLRENKILGGYNTSNVISAQKPDKRVSISIAHQDRINNKDYSVKMIGLGESKKQMMSAKKSMIRPVKTEKDMYKYLCPICFRYFTRKGIDFNRF